MLIRAGESLCPSVVKLHAAPFAFPRPYPTAFVTGWVDLLFVQVIKVDARFPVVLLRVNRLAVRAKPLQSSLDGVLVTTSFTLIDTAEWTNLTSSFATLVGGPLLALTICATRGAIERTRTALK